MEKEEFLKILGMIAEGSNPYEDAIDNDLLPEKNPITIRALCIAVMALLSETDRQKLQNTYSSRKSTDYIDLVSGPLESYLREIEANKIREALYSSNFDMKTAAEIAGYDSETFERKANRYGFGTLGFVAHYFSKETGNGVSLDDYIENLEKKMIEDAIGLKSGNKTEAADLLGISFRSMRHRIGKYALRNVNLDLHPNSLEFFENDSIDEFLSKIEKEIIIQALNKTSGNKTEAADLLGITFRSIRHKVDLFNL
jgi:DNA-binding NtrC family response regulator